MIRIAALFTLTVAAVPASFAGPFNLSAVSRANCLNHESITWDASHAMGSSPYIMAMDQTVIHADDTVEFRTEYDAEEAHQSLVCWGCHLQYRVKEVTAVHYVAASSNADLTEMIDYLESQCPLAGSQGSYFDFGIAYGFAHCFQTQATNCNPTDW